MISHDKQKLNTVSLDHQMIVSHSFSLIGTAPARAVTKVFCAPLTAGPWSAMTIEIISMNLVQ